MRVSFGFGKGVAEFGEVVDDGVDDGEVKHDVADFSVFG
jgi:hypothetical protein